MKTKSANWLRWILVFPGAILTGFIATFPLHWLLYFLLNGGESDLGSLKFFAQLFSFGASYQEAEFLLTPFVIAIFYIIGGVEIAPKHKIKTAFVLFGIYFLSWLIVALLALSQGQTSQIGIRTVLAIIGAILGVIIVKIQFRKQSAKLENSQENSS